MLFGYCLIFMGIHCLHYFLRLFLFETSYCRLHKQRDSLSAGHSSSYLGHKRAVGVPGVP